MDRLWVLKFTSMFPVPGNALSFFFADEETPKAILNNHISALSRKIDDPMPILSFDDLMGSHCLRSSFFPHCAMMEIGPSDLAWRDINQKIEAAQKAAGLPKDVGFKGEEKV